MNQTEHILLGLIRQSLWGNEYPIPDDVDWIRISKEADDQAVHGLVQTPSSDKAAMEIEQTARFTRYMVAQEDTVFLLRKANIPFVIIKGAASAIYYPEPYRRAMGDIDIVVPTEKFEKAVDLFKLNGFLQQGDFDSSKREMHFCKDKMNYELHYRFSDSDLDVERFISNGFTQIATGIIEEYRFPMLPSLSNGIVLLAHMRHHLQTGLGLRQVIDWMMYCDRVLDNDYWNDSFESAVEEIGLKKLAVTATFLCQKYLGLKKTITWCKDADEKICDDLMENLMVSGNFGAKNGTGRWIENTNANLKREGLLRYLQKAGEHNWKAYHKHPSLKPVCWLYQIFRYARLGVNAKRGGNLTDDLNRGKKRYELLKDLGIE